MSQLIHDIETITTAGELGALLLESTLVKKYKPMYNSMLREARKMVVLFSSTDSNGFSTIKVKELDKIDVNETEKIIGIFKSKKQLKNHLFELSKQFNLCPKLLGLDHSKKLCFYYHLNICHGACDGKELNIKYNMRFTEAFHKYKLKRWIFDSPILVKEENEIKEGFIIDKWCLLGSVKSENDIYEIDQEYSFDLDTYKILSKYLSNPPKNLSINKFDLQKLNLTH
jgi:DNA polymerase-3 subunit epsilon